MSKKKKAPPGNAKYIQWLLPHNLILLEGWARDGLTDEQLAERIGVSRKTFHVWRKKYPEIHQATLMGKEVTDQLVARTLLEKAKGYKYTEQQAMKTKEVFYDDEGRRCEKETVVIVDLEKEAPPDTTAIIFWLKNRDRVNWRDKHEVEVSANTESSDKLGTILGQLTGVDENNVIDAEVKERD